MKIDTIKGHWSEFSNNERFKSLKSVLTLNNKQCRLFATVHILESSVNNGLLPSMQSGNP